MSDNNSNDNDDSYLYQSDDWPWVWAIRATPEEGGLDWRHGLSPAALTDAMTRQEDSLRPVPLLYHLWIGSQLSCLNVKHLLDDIGITHVMNLSGSRASVEPLEQAGLICWTLPDVADVNGYPLLSRHLTQARAFVASMKQTHGDAGMCVVYCTDGLNCACLLAAALIMLETRWPVLQVVKLVRQQCGDYALENNESFQEQLVALARQEGLLGLAPGKTGSLVKQAPPPSRQREAPIDQWVHLTSCDCGKC